MIRPFTCLAAVLAAGSGLYLYSEKHRTTLLDGRIDAVVGETRLVRAQTSMLEAEWALLNQPDRLQQLAARFLPVLQPIAPTQFVQLADLGSHLPALGPPPVSAVSPTVPSVNAPAPGVSPTPGASPDDSGVPIAATTAAPTLLLSAATGTPHPVPDAKPVDDTPRHAAIRLAGLNNVPTLSRRHAAPRRLAAASDETPAYTAVAAHWRAIAAYSRPAPVLATAWSRPVSSPAPSYTGSALGIGGGIAPPMAAPAAR